MKDERVIRARWVAPMDSPLIRNGAVAFADGRILEVGPAAHVLRAHPNAAVIDLDDALLLPGLVNAHTHLELSNCTAGDSPGGSFTEWILSLPRRIGRDEGKSL